MQTLLTNVQENLTFILWEISDLILLHIHSILALILISKERYIFVCFSYKNVLSRKHTKKLDTLTCLRYPGH